MTVSWLFVGGIPSDNTPPFPPPAQPPPLISATSVVPASLGIGQTATIYFTWNDAVFNFTPGAVAVTNGSIGALTEVDSEHFTAIFTPAVNIDAAATIQVQQSGTGDATYYNAAGSATEASNIATIAVDTVLPVPPPLMSAISVSPTSVGVGQTATVSFTWNDTVLAFASAAVTVTNGSIGALTQVDATHFTAIFTPTASINATATIQVQQSGVGGAV